MAEDLDIKVTLDFLEENSQIGQFLSGNSDDEKEAKKKAEAYTKRYAKLMSEINKAEGEEKLKIGEKIESDLKTLRDYEEEQRAKDKKARLKEEIEYALSLEEKLEKEKELEILELKEAANKKILEALTSTFDSIIQAGKDYADYVERLEVGLIGSTKSYDSVSEKLSKVFSLNVFFSMDEALRKTTEMVEKGINYNVELRASLATMSDKIVKTFDALEPTLLRIVKIQQADSTQARLGMESLLQEYLNSNFQTSEYLHGLSDQVSGYLLETEALKTKEGAVEFEYAVQKWLGSFSSLGVSDATIQALAQGIGYLGSGDVSSLAGNEALQQLLTLSIQKGGGSKSYGDMLTSGLEVSDISSIFTGFYKLVKQINSTESLAAMNQYADLFGLTMSDITSVLSLTSESVEQIANSMVEYQTTINRVNEELTVSKLYSRTSASEIFNNIKKNMFTSIGLDMADSLALSLMYESLNQAADVLGSLKLKTEVMPWGLGAGIELTAGDVVKGVVGNATYLAAYLKNISALGSALSPDLSKLGGEETVKIMGGTGLNQVITGESRNQQTYIGRDDQTGILETVNQSSKQTSSEVLQVDVDKEQENMKKQQEALDEINDNVAFIVKMLNIDGIKIRPDNSHFISTKDPEENSTLIMGGY